MNAVDVFASVITVKGFDFTYEKRLVVNYLNKYYSANYQKYIIKEHFHVKPDSSKFPTDSLRVGQCYFLTAARIDRTWFLMCAINSDTGEYIYDPEITEQVRSNLEVQQEQHGNI